MSYTENSEAVQKEKKGLRNYADTVVSGTYDKNKANDGRKYFPC